MRKKGNIVSYSADEIKTMVERGESQTDWARVDSKSEEELAADIASDPDWAGVPEDWFIRGQIASGLMKGRTENKLQVTMRFDADVVAYFKNQGRGWQGRMNAVLRSFMEQDRAAAKNPPQPRA